ncbi:MAG TPA: hypothetical protein V6C57_16190 [Coleofasciculaceae cyanobacterium]
MLNVVRRSQILGLIAMDGATATHLGEVEEVWLDESGQIAYLSSTVGYLPLEQIAGIGTYALSTYGDLVVDAPLNLHPLHHLPVQSALAEPLGWVEDFLFDWHSGEVVAYILAGDIAEQFGGRAVLYPEDVPEIAIERMVIPAGTEKQLRSESEGLQGFLSEKSQQVQHLVQVIDDRLHDLISPHDQPERVRIKVNAVHDELAASGNHDHHALREATEFLHDQWASLQQNIAQAGERAKVAFDEAWQHLTTKR